MRSLRADGPTNGLVMFKTREVNVVHSLDSPESKFKQTLVARVLDHAESAKDQRMTQTQAPHSVLVLFIQDPPFHPLNFSARERLV